MNEQLVVSNKIKSGSGDSSSLYQDRCDGTTSESNAAQFVVSNLYQMS